MSPWKPSDTQEGLQWWARFTLRYLIGGGGLVWCVAVDKLKNPTALVIFGGIAGIPDVLGYRAAVKAQAEEAQRERDSR